MNGILSMFQPGQGGGILSRANNMFTNNPQQILGLGLGLLSGQSKNEQLTNAAQGFMAGSLADREAAKQRQAEEQAARSRAASAQALREIAGNNPRLPQGLDWNALAGTGFGDAIISGAVKDAYTPKVPKDTRTNDKKNYDEAVKGGYDGTFFEYLGDVKRAGAPSVNIDTGSKLGPIPKSHEVVVGPDGNSQMRIIPGSPAEKAGEAKNVAAAKQRSVVTDDIDRAIKLVEDSWDVFPTTGIGGSALSYIPGSDAHDVSKLMDSVRANVGFDQLNQMRASSPTGGALGQVTERELGFLQSVMGSLEQSQSEEQFLYNLKRVRKAFAEIIHTDIHSDNPSGAFSAGSAADPLGIR